MLLDDARLIGKPSPRFNPDNLWRATDLDSRGSRPGELVAVRRGIWTPASAWQGLFPIQRHAALVHATAMVTTPEHMFSLASAAAIWGLPRITAWPGAVTVQTRARLGSSEVVRYHRGEPIDPVMVDGIAVTPLLRTLSDLARTQPLLEAVTAIDYVLNQRLCTRDEVVKEFDLIGAGIRGRRQARRALNLSDGRSMSAGESLSRVQMFVLRLPEPDLQRRYDDEHGLIGYADFDWEGVIGEFDGKMKYRLPEGATAAEYAELVDAERRRENRMRRQSKDFTRWDMRTAYRRDVLARHLAAHGIRPQRRPTWII